MEPTYCANSGCPAHTEHRGGKFRLVNGEWYCYPSCAENLAVMSPAKNLWDYSTTHIHPDAKPVYIGSLANMRKLEKQYGVSSQVANYDSSKW